MTDETEQQIDRKHLEDCLHDRNREITEKAQKVRQLSFELYAARVALREIKDGRRPQVCENYELCTHVGCHASYEAFAIADAYFTKMPEQTAGDGHLWTPEELLALAEEIIRPQCTGQDDHDIENCAKCADMIRSVVSSFNNIIASMNFAKASDAVVQEGIDFAKKIAARLHLCSNPSHWDEPHPCMLCEQEKKS